MCFVVNSIFSRIKDNHFLRETQSYYHLFESLFSLVPECNENKNALFSAVFLLLNLVGLVLAHLCFTFAVSINQ